MEDAADRWRRALGEWSIPKAILDAAPESPWMFPPGVFARRAEEAVAEAPTPSHQRALELLEDGGTVLDVGVGGGAASLPLAPPAGLLIGVDQGEGMLEAFTAAAERRGVASQGIPGAWPDVAGEAPVADVVVCHHVFYNVGDLVPFAAALTDHARRRVVVELTGEHPTSNLNPLWRRIHGLERPTSPTAEDAIAVLTEMGLDVGVEEREVQWSQSGADRDDVVAMLRRRLCVGPERDGEIAAHLDAEGPTSRRRTLTLWWGGRA
ncbi:MAG: methyltransferase domain-containing protein [Acidimicrobiales bacterium]